MNIATSDIEQTGGTETLESMVEEVQTEIERDAIRKKVRAILTGIPQLISRERLTFEKREQIAAALAQMEDCGLARDEANQALQLQLNIHPARIAELKGDEDLPFKKLSTEEQAAFDYAKSTIKTEMEKRTPKSKKAFSDKLRKALIVAYRYFRRLHGKDGGSEMKKKYPISVTILSSINNEFFGKPTREIFPEAYPPQTEATAEVLDDHSPVAPIIDDTTPSVEPASAEITPIVKPDVPQEPATAAMEPALAPTAENTDNEERMGKQLEQGDRLINELSQLRDDLRAVLLERQNPSAPAANALIPNTPVKAVPAEISESPSLTEVQFGGVKILVARGSKVMVIEG